MSERFVREVNVKYDMPTSDTAIKRVTFGLRTAEAMGAGALKIIHGYGSTGKGGKIRLEVRRYLDSQKKQGKIRGYICGEDFSIFDTATLEAFRHCGGLRSDADLERHNNGVTIAILK
ncbi:MAG: Smr/MutS family protein [Clostridiales bacterium]|nr:Smr/MutS family protein [Clostridiales bacterium]